MGQALSSCTPCLSRSAKDNDEDFMDDDFDVDDEAQSGDEEENSNGSDSEGSRESNDVPQLQKSDEEPRKTCQLKNPRYMQNKKDSRISLLPTFIFSCMFEIPIREG